MTYDPAVLLMNKLGMPREHAELFVEYNIRTEFQLMVELQRRHDREHFSKETRIPVEKILEYLHVADLRRIKGLGLIYIRLLQLAGCRTVHELSFRSPRLLQESLKKVKMPELKSPPNISFVRSWINQAKVLPRFMLYR